MHAGKREVTCIMYPKKYMEYVQKNKKIITTLLHSIKYYVKITPTNITDVYFNADEVELLWL